MPTLIAVDVWKTTPFMALLILAGLQLIPRELYEAARVDGAGRLKQFLSVTLPLLKPTLAVALIFRTLDALRVFDVFSGSYGKPDVLYGLLQLLSAYWKQKHGSCLGYRCHHLLSHRNLCGYLHEAYGS